MAANLLAVTLILFFLLLYVPRIIRDLQTQGPWTSGFEILALCGYALVLASALSGAEKNQAAK